MKLSIKRFKKTILLALPKAGKTSLWLLKIIIPVSLVVTLMQYFGLIQYIADYLGPLFSHIGLPGEASIVFLTSIFLPLYAPIAIIATLPLSSRDILLLAVMCLIAHNLFVETAVQAKTGSKFHMMFILRIVTAFVAAFLLNKILPPADTAHSSILAETEILTLTATLYSWLISSLYLILKIVLIITALMIMQAVLQEYKVLDALSRFFAPLMQVMGLPRSSSFLWLVAHLLGLAYGSAVMIEEVENGKLSLSDVNLLNYHVAVNHSTLEDTLLFVAIGVPFLWMAIPRFILSIIIVWGVRFLMRFKKKKQ